MRLCKVIMVIAASWVCPALSMAQQWTSLFDGKSLSGWDTWIGPAYDTVNDRWQEKGLGLNNDVHHVFSVVTENGSPAMKVSGEYFGGISTKASFENYHLRLQFKWGQRKWAPRKTQKRDSGILYHAVGEHGADFGFWMRSQEFQVQEEDCGDYWGVAGGSFEIRSSGTGPEKYVYNSLGQLRVFNEASPNGRRCMKSVDAEKPNGEWNTAEIICYGDTAVHILNGQVVMVLYNSGQLEGGQVRPLTKGKIQIQSEGAEVFYRNVEIRPIRRIPTKLLE